MHRNLVLVPCIGEEGEIVVDIVQEEVVEEPDVVGIVDV